MRCCIVVQTLQLLLVMMMMMMRLVVTAIRILTCQRRAPKKVLQLGSVYSGLGLNMMIIVRSTGRTSNSSLLQLLLIDCSTSVDGT
jgi:hypothetical protein